jgi:hypothetical protein
VDVKRVLAPLLLVVALLAIAVAGHWLNRPAETVAVPCADAVAGCAFVHRGAPVRARFSARPVPLEAFSLHVDAPGANRVRAEFQMRGMDMGFNRYDLRRAGDGSFFAQATLPVCVSGRRDWVMYLELDGTRYALPFSTG